MQKHSTKVNEACAMLIPFFEACYADDWDTAQQIRNKISELEKQADLLKREIRLKLPRGILCRLNVVIY